MPPMQVNPVLILSCVSDNFLSYPKSYNNNFMWIFILLGLVVFGIAIGERCLRRKETARNHYYSSLRKIRAGHSTHDFSNKAEELKKDYLKKMRFIGGGTIFDEMATMNDLPVIDTTKIKQG